jgi:MGT family glycosyltransferase
VTAPAPEAPGGASPPRGGKTFLLVPLPEAGHLLVMLAIAAELRSRSHRVLVYAPTACAEAVGASGAALLARADYQQSDVLARTFAEATRRPAPAAGRATGALRALAHVRRLGWAFRQLVVECSVLTAKGLARVAARERPAVVVADSFAFGARYAAELLDLPFATLGTDPTISLNARGTPALPPDPRMAHIPPTLWRAAVDLALPLERARRELGLPRARRGPAEFYASMVSDALHLVCAPRAMAREAPAPGHLFVGPMSFDWPPPPAHFDESIVPQGAVLVSGTTVGSADAVAIFHRMLRAAAALGRPTVVTAGAAGRPPELPPHVHWLEGLVPHAKVLPRVEALITHGGWGVVGRALRFGVPTLIVPAFGPQPMVARRLCELGLSLHLPASELSDASMRRAFGALSGDGELAGRVRAFRAELAHLNSAALAADALERLAG